MKDPKRYELLFGPYHPPRSRIGKFLVCERRGKVKVGNFSDALIPWPMCRHSLILCGDLVRAVRQESVEAIRHHWGVSRSTVWEFRKALGIRWKTPGSSQLASNSFRERVPVRMGALIWALTRNRKAARALLPRLLGQPMHRETRHAIEQLVRRPKSKRARRQLYETIKRRGCPNLDWNLGKSRPGDDEERVAKKIRELKAELQITNDLPDHRPWTQREDKLLGTMSNKRVAKILKRGLQSVMDRRKEKGILKPRPRTRPWTPEEEKLLGIVPDDKLARELDRSHYDVNRRRLEKGILKHEMRYWTPEEDKLLGTDLDGEIAEVLGRSKRSVFGRRVALNIPVVRTYPIWTAKEDQLVGTKPDQAVARMLGRTLAAVQQRRLKLGKRLQPRRNRWRNDELKILAKFPPKEAAQKLGRSLIAVRRKRLVLGY